MQQIHQGSPFDWGQCPKNPFLICMVCGPHRHIHLKYCIPVVKDLALFTHIVPCSGQ